MALENVLESGTRVGNYTIDRLLDMGSFSQVYLGYSEDNEKVVLKVARSHGGKLNWDRLRYVKQVMSYGEGIILGNNGFTKTTLDQRGTNSLLEEEFKKTRIPADSDLIVRASEIFVAEGKKVLVLPYAEGYTLRNILDDDCGIKWKWFSQIARELKDAKDEYGFYHGDVKPENIIITKEGRGKLIDPAVKIKWKGNTVQTMTPRYNPFLFEGEKADVAALGMVMYESVTGEVPFDKVPWEYAGKIRKLDREWKLELAYYLSFPPVEEVENWSKDKTRLFNRVVRWSVDPTARYKYADMLRDMQFLMDKR